MDAACVAEIWVPPVRLLTSMAAPAASTLWYSQKRRAEVALPPVTVQPVGEM